MPENTTLSPMMKQFFDVKSLYPDAIIFFRLGDFYELFDQDAIKISPILGLTLTKRQEFAMCGFPHHSKHGYIHKLIKKNFKVAICDQIEILKNGKTIFDRQVTELITPGTYIDIEQIDSRYILSINIDKDIFTYALIEPSTGVIILGNDSFSENTLLSILEKYKPSEILYPENLSSSVTFLFKEIFHTPLEDSFFQTQNNTSFLSDHLDVKSLADLNINDENTINVLGAVLRYIKNNFQKDMTHIKNLNFINSKTHLYLSDSTIKHLEIIDSLHKSDLPSSLYQQINLTKTSLGARYLKHTLVNPSLDLQTIKERQNIVELFTQQISLLEKIRLLLSLIPDIEKLFGKISLKVASPKDIWNLYLGLEKAQDILDALKGSIILEDASFIPHHEIHSVTHFIQSQLEENPPIQFGEEPVIKKEASLELVDLRKKAFDSYSVLLDIEKEERELSGLSKLKLKYNKILGYYFEIPKGSASKVPSHFIRKQSLVNVERFTIEPLITFESQVLESKNQLLEKELELFNALNDKIISYHKEIESYCDFIKKIDMLHSFAYKAVQSNYIKPTLVHNGALIIEDGRHPVVEYFIDRFIPNSVELNHEDKRLSLITGPNMAGKSTFLRQTAIITLLAHIGSFVPAKKAQIPITDKIFTRIGASDNLAKGESTFFIEMAETAQILKEATERSLIIMDEIGRGTSTSDGLSIAWAIVHYLCDPNILRGKTLFATHYHELSHIENTHKGIQNLRVTISEYDNKVIFLHKVEKGIASESYGIHVAKLAGIPYEVLDNAYSILSQLEQKNTSLENIKPKDKKDNTKNNILEKIINGYNINEMTPLQAFKAIEELQLLTQKK